MSINPDVPARPYSVWAQDNADEAERRRALIKAWLGHVQAHADWLAQVGAYLPGTSAEELAEHVREVLDGDWSCGRDRDLEHFEEQTG